MKKHILFTVAIAIAINCIAQNSSLNKYHQWATTPPLGWNSPDYFGTTVTEQQVREQADAMAKQLLPSGYKCLTVDFKGMNLKQEFMKIEKQDLLIIDDFGLQYCQGL